MVSRVENSTLQHHVQYNGIIQALVADDEVAIFSGFLEFAVHHTLSDIKVYENAGSNAVNRDIKLFFIQLAGRKMDVSNKLKMQQSGSSARRLAEKLRNGQGLSRFVKETEADLFAGVGDAKGYARRKEGVTLGLYEKMRKKVQQYSTTALFEYLIESQRILIDFTSMHLPSSQQDPVLHAA